MIREIPLQYSLNHFNVGQNFSKKVVDDAINVGVVTALMATCSAITAPALTGLTFMGGAVYGIGLLFGVKATRQLFHLIDKTVDGQLGLLLNKTNRIVKAALCLVTTSAVPFYITRFACSRFAHLGSIAFGSSVGLTTFLLLAPIVVKRILTAIADRNI